MNFPTCYRCGFKEWTKLACRTVSSIDSSPLRVVIDVYKCAGYVYGMTWAHTDLEDKLK